MIKAFCLSLLLLPYLVAEARILGESIAVNPHALPGDSDATQLALPGLQIHEFNDYFGRTDKLITGGGKARLMMVGNYFSSSLTFKGSYIQPILETRNDQPPLAHMIGVHAESIETALNFSYTNHRSKGSIVGLKLNFGIGYVDVGDHGLVNLYRQVHTAVNSPKEDDKFGEKIKESYSFVSYGAALVFPLLKQVNFSLGVSVYNSRPFYEYAYESSLIVSLSRNYALSMKYQFIDQKKSEWWSLMPQRHQFLLGLRLFEYWTPSLMVVSSYVKGDEYGQLYLSPVSLTIPF